MIVKNITEVIVGEKFTESQATIKLLRTEEYDALVAIPMQSVTVQRKNENVRVVNTMCYFPSVQKCGILTTQRIENNKPVIGEVEIAELDVLIPAADVFYNDVILPLFKEEGML